MTRPLALLSLMLVLPACGAIQSTSYLLDADVQLEAARTASADKYAPYQFTSASLYLHKAREEAGFSNYDTAVDYSRQASRFANEAKELSLSRAKNDSSSPVPSTP